MTTSDSLAQSLSTLLVIAIPLVVAAAGLVTGLKSRTGWLLVGCLFAGVPWLASAWLPAEPGSWWARRRDHGGRLVS